MSAIEYEPIENLSVKKSNALVSAKYQSSLIENQIMAIALTRIESKAKSGNEALHSTLYPGELKRIIGDPQNIYRTLKKVSNVMTGHTIFIEDGNGNFRAHAIVTDAIYENGVFTINFNENLRPHVLGLEKSYTSYELSVLTGFKKNASFRLYELLKSHIYKGRKNPEGRVDVVYNLSELRFMIGLANGDDQRVRNAAAAMAPHVDWDILYTKLEKKDRKYEVWADFQRCVLQPAQQELKEKSNIRFEYEGRRTRGRKISEILFSIYPNEPVDAEAINEKSRLIEKNSLYRQLEMPRDQFPEFYEKYEHHNDLEKEDLDLLLFKAGNDVEKVEAAITEADRQGYIGNYMGWIISYLTAPREYRKTEVIEGSAKQAQAVRKIRRNYEDNRESTASRVWERMKKKEEFADFAQDLQEQGVSLDQFEEAFDHSEMADIFIAWKKTGVIDM